MAIGSSSLFCLCHCLRSEIDILQSMVQGPSQLRVKRTMWRRYHLPLAENKGMFSRAKKEFVYPTLVTESKSFDARLGNLPTDLHVQNIDFGL